MRQPKPLAADLFLRQALRPTAKNWLIHTLLLVAALFTATVAGVLQPFGFVPIFPDVNPQSWEELFQFLASFQFLYSKLISDTIRLLLSDATAFKHGLSFSVSLLAILTAHEAGHYVACRLYGVDATLPYFIPTPPLIGPAGTLGAFIKILSPMPSRRATFDIGVAGPIAGFLVIIPVSVLGLLTMRQAEVSHLAEAGSLIFSDPLLMKLLAYLSGVDLSRAVLPNPFYAAAWIGLLVTSLNLIPSGQLDGGHAVFAVFGARVHRWTGRIAFVVMATATILGFYLYNSPSGLLFTILLGVMLRLRHPAPLDDAPLDSGRRIFAVLVLLIFILCFVPFPIQIN